MGDPTNTLQVRTLLATETIAVRDVRCDGACGHRSPSECATATQLVFPYRGTFQRHVGRTATVAEASQMVFFNADEEYCVSHPVGGGDACLSIAPDPALLLELASVDQLDNRPRATFNRPAHGIDPRAQALVALLRHSLGQGTIETLEAETLALTLIRRSLGERTSHVRATTYGRARLVDRTKLLLAADPGRRWALAEIATEMGVSPVYLTQVFKQVEGVPLYRYQLRLRLSRALDLLPRCTDLTGLALDLGFSSHSHFTAAFRGQFGRSPSALMLAAGARRIA